MKEITSMYSGQVIWMGFREKRDLSDWEWADGSEMAESFYGWPIIPSKVPYVGSLGRYDYKAKE